MTTDEREAAIKDYYKPVQQYADRLTGKKSDEYRGEAVTAMCSAVYAFEPGRGELGAFVYTAVKNAVVDVIRREQTYNTFHNGAAGLEKVASRPDSTPTAEDLDAVTPLLSSLSVDDANLIREHAILGESMRTLAVRWNTTYDKIKSRINSIRLSLQPLNKGQPKCEQVA